MLLLDSSWLMSIGFLLNTRHRLMYVTLQSPIVFGFSFCCYSALFDRSHNGDFTER